MAIRKPLRTGPCNGVRDNKDPFDGSDQYYQDLVNCYIPDPGQSGAYARPGMECHNKLTPFDGLGQAAFTYVDPADDSLYNFLVVGGKIYRANASLSSYTDVTPTQTQYRLWFQQGTGTEPTVGDIVTGATSSATGTVLRVTVTSGDFLDSNAVGYYTFSVTSGTFQAGETIEVTSANVGQASGPATDSTIRIDPNAIRVYWWTFMGTLVISDQVNPPWVLRDFDAPELTGEYIDYDGKGTPWSAYGRPQDYGGAWIFIVNTIDGVKHRFRLTWSNPGDVLTGYFQPDFDYTWDLSQTGEGAIYAIWGTNVALYYFRDSTIGTLAGIPGPDFRNTHTADAIAANIGCTQSATIQQFGNTIYFCDQIGRPHSMQIGGAPVEIWKQMRTAAERSTIKYPTVTAQVAHSVVEPTLNLWLVAIWAPVPGQVSAPTQLFAFDAKTGTYVGRWVIGYGAQIETMGILNNSYGSGSLVIVGTAPGPPNGIALATEDYELLLTEAGFALSIVDYLTPRTGVVWVMNAALGGGDTIATEDGDPLTTEDGDPLIVESVHQLWTDDGNLPLIGVATHRLGYTDDMIWNLDMGTVLTQSQGPIQMAIRSSTMQESVQGTPETNPSDDETYRTVFGTTASGRGFTLIVRPQTAEEQFVFQRATLIGVPSRATWQES